MSGGIFNAGAVVVKMQAKMDEWNASTRTIKKDMTTIQGFAARNEKQLKKMSGSFAKVAAVTTLAFTVFLNSSIKLNKGLANVATLAPKSTQQILNLKSEVQDLSIKYGKAAEDLTGGSYQIVSAFGAQALASKKLDLTARAAAAGMATTADTLNYLSAVTKGYNKTTDEAYERASDLGFMTVKLGQTTFPELAASIGRAIPTAAKMGVGVAELHAEFATLTGVTGNAAEVSTQVAGILRGMIKPTQGMKAAISALGYSTAEGMIKNLGMVGSLKALIGTTDGTSESVGKLFRRAEALTAIFALTGAQAADFKRKFAEMKEAAGATGEAFIAMSSGINKTGYEFEQTKQRVAVLSQNIGDSLIPIFSTLLDIVSPGITLFSNMAVNFKALPAPIKFITTGMIALTGATVALIAMKAKLLVLWGKIPARLAKMAVAMGPYVAAIMAGYAAYTAIKAAAEKAGKAHDKHMGIIASTAQREKKIFDALIAFKKQATAEDLGIYRQSIAMKKTLLFASHEQRLKFQQNFLLKNSANFSNFWKNRQKNLKGNLNDENVQTDEQRQSIAAILKKSRETQKQATLNEFDFRIWKARQAYEAEKKILDENRASKEEFIELQRGYNSELKAIEKDRLEYNTQKQKEENEKRQEANEAFYEHRRLQIEEFDGFVREQDTLAEFEALTGRERQRAELDRWHQEQRQKLIALLRFNILQGTTFTAMRIALEKQFYNEKNKLDDDDEKTWIGRLNKKLKKYYEYFQVTFASFKGYLDAKQKKLDTEYEKEKAFIEANITDEAERKAALEKLDAEYTEKRRKMERQKAMYAKVSNIASAIMNTAAAVTKALTAGPFLGPVLAGIIGVMGAAQVAMIARTPIPMAVGGRVKEEGMALLHKDEVVMPYERAMQIERTNTFVERRFSSPPREAAGTRGGGGDTVNIYINTIDGSNLEEIFDTKIIPLIQSRTRTENLLIYKGAVKEHV